MVQRVNVCSNILSEWLAQIWQRRIKWMCFSCSYIDWKQKSRQKSLNMLQIALHKTRCHRCAWSWKFHWKMVQRVNVCSNMLSEWLAQIWQRGIKWMCFSCSYIDRKQKLSKAWSNKTDTIWTSQDVKYYANISEYVPVISTLVTNLNHAWSQVKSNFYLGKLSVVLASISHGINRHLHMQDYHLL